MARSEVFAPRGQGETQNETDYFDVRDCGDDVQRCGMSGQADRVSDLVPSHGGPAYGLRGLSDTPGLPSRRVRASILQQGRIPKQNLQKPRVPGWRLLQRERSELLAARSR